MRVGIHDDIPDSLGIVGIGIDIGIDTIRGVIFHRFGLVDSIRIAIVGLIVAWLVARLRLIVLVVDGIRFRLAVIGGLVIRLGIGIRFSLDASYRAIVGIIGIVVSLHGIGGVRHIGSRLAVSMAIVGIRIRIRIRIGSRFDWGFRRLIAIRVGERVGGRGGGSITTIGTSLFGFLIKLVGASLIDGNLPIGTVAGYCRILLEIVLVLDNLIGRHIYIQSLFNQSVFTLYDSRITIAPVHRSSQFRHKQKFPVDSA